MLPTEHAPNDGDILDDYVERNCADGEYRVENQRPRSVSISAAERFDDAENQHVQIDGADQGDQKIEQPMAGQRSHGGQHHVARRQRHRRPGVQRQRQ